MNVCEKYGTIREETGEETDICKSDKRMSHLYVSKGHTIGIVQLQYRRNNNEFLLHYEGSLPLHDFKTTFSHP